MTAADEAAEAIILPALRELAPEIPCVAEEAVARERSAGDRSPRPLLAGRSARRHQGVPGGNGEFTVNIALIENGRPVLGVVHLPALGTTYAAARPARRSPSGERRQAIAARPKPADGIIVLASRSHNEASPRPLSGRDAVAERIAAGSSLKFCLIAEGQADIYPRFGPTMEWDTAAGQRVLEAAGGEVVHDRRQAAPLRQAGLRQSRISSPAAAGAEQAARRRSCDAEPRTRHRRGSRDALRAGELVAFPTETVYGLGGDATNERAVAAIFEAKDRPQLQSADHPCADAGRGRGASCDWNDTRRQAGRAHSGRGRSPWCCRAREDCPVSLLATAGLDTVAIRAPAPSRGAGAAPRRRPADRRAVAPIRRGAVSPTRRPHVAESLGDRVAMILDGGPLPIGLESTVLDLTAARADAAAPRRRSRARRSRR